EGDFVAARARLEESVALWRGLGDQRGLALALTYTDSLGWVLLMERRVAAAGALFAGGTGLWGGTGGEVRVGRAARGVGGVGRGASVQESGATTLPPRARSPRRVWRCFGR